MIVFRKARNPQQTLNDLDAYISGLGYEPVKWLAREVQTWGEFSYSELEAAILDGRLNELIDWQARYATAINEIMAPQWSAAICAAAKKSSRGKIILSDSEEWVKAWVTVHGAELATRLSDESKKAIANVLLKWQGELLQPSKMAQQIRPLIGLNERQAIANANYRTKVYQKYLESMTPAKAAERADKAAIRYASKQHRYRAETIVHTELAFAYNQGAHEGIMRSIAGKYMNRCAMIWTTAGVIRTCGRCLELNGKVVGHTDESGVQIPPLHPRCRCAIIYRELAETPKPKEFKTEIEKLRQKLETQRSQGATPAEIEKTIKEAGKLVIAERKKVKVFDLPPEQRIDLPLLEKTLKDFEKRLSAMGGNKPRELREINRILNEELWDFQEQAFKELSVIQKGRAEQLKKILSQVRAMGASKEQLIAQFGKSNSVPCKIFKTAVDYYPTDWVEESIKRGALKAKKPTKKAPHFGRAYYSSSTATITVNPEYEDIIETAFHEFGHRIENTNQAILEAEAQFYSRRTAGEKLELMRDVTGNPDYRRDEVTRKDKFLNPYMGKDYGGRCYELVSMGFQWAYTNPAMLLQDEDMAEWIFGMLAIL